MGRAGRVTLRTGTGDARAQNGRADYGVPRRSRSRKNIRENLGSLSSADAFCASGDSVCSADFCAKDASVELMDAKHAEMQKELERVRDVAEAWFKQSDEERERHRAEFQNKFPRYYAPGRSPSFTGIFNFLAAAKGGDRYGFAGAFLVQQRLTSSSDETFWPSMATITSPPT